jgi:hypothetical protein
MRRTVRSSASVGDISIFSARNSFFGNNFSKRGTKSIKIGKSSSSADETVFLK